MVCDLCGKGDAIYVVLVEGTKMGACESCKGFGKIIQRNSPVTKQLKKETVISKPAEKKEELIERLVLEYGNIIRKKRESLGLNQEDFAKKLNIKLSMLHQIESNKFLVNIETAKDIEKKLGIKIIEVEKEEKSDFQKSKNGPLTIGDIFEKIKNKK